MLNIFRSLSSVYAVALSKCLQKMEHIQFPGNNVPLKFHKLHHKWVFPLPLKMVQISKTQHDTGLKCEQAMNFMKAAY